MWFVIAETYQIQRLTISNTACILCLAKHYEALEGKTKIGKELF